MVLLQNVVNGDYNSTHQVNIFYPDGAAMDQSAPNNRCEPSLEEVPERPAESRPSRMGKYLRHPPGKSGNPVMFQLNADQHHLRDHGDRRASIHACTFDDLEVPRRSGVPRQIYLGEVIAAGTMPGTHFVLFVADTRRKLTEAMMALQGTEAMASYAAAASGTRTLEATNMTTEIKRWVNN